MLAFKLALVPILIALVSLAGQRFGPLVAGLLAGFPMVAGPIFIFMTVEQGDIFGVQAAIGTLVGLVGYTAFALSYAWLCRTRHWLPCLGLAWLIFLAISLVFSRFHFDLPTACLLGLAAPILGPRLFPPITSHTRRGNMHYTEILLRMGAAAALVLTLTETAASAGPTLSGLLTPFPVAGSVLAVFSHRHSGAAATIQLLRGVLLGLYGFVAFFAVVALALPTQSLAPSLGFALIAALIAQGITYRLTTRSITNN